MVLMRECLTVLLLVLTFIKAFVPFPTSAYHGAMAVVGPQQQEPFGASRLQSSFNNEGEDTSSTRKAKQAELDKIKARFSTGEDLKHLRNDLEALRTNKEWARKLGDEARVRDLSEAIRLGEAQDPDCAYCHALNMIAEVSRASQEMPSVSSPLIEKWSLEALAARSCIPRFQLGGLWVGNYGDNGYQLINVTYVGDCLKAVKVTADKNVPRGELTFTADLGVSSIKAERNKEQQADMGKDDGKELKPIELSKDAAQKWGLEKLERFKGKGQIAKNGFADKQMVDGQLILFDNHFSFVWTETRHHVFFGRPSDDVILKMLRDVISKEDEVENMRQHAERCFHMDYTDCVALHQEKKDGKIMEDGGDSIDPENVFRRISSTDDLEKLEALLNPPETSNVQNFWNVQHWKNYIDKALGEGRSDAHKS